jgi:hypothetical protein
MVGRVFCGQVAVQAMLGPVMLAPVMLAQAMLNRAARPGVACVVGVLRQLAPDDQSRNYFCLGSKNAMSRREAASSR